MRWKNEGLDSSAFALDPDSWEVREHQALEGGQRRLQWSESWRGSGWDGNWALGSDASTIFIYRQLGDLALAPPVVQD